MSTLATLLKDKDYVVQGILWWTYQGETLKQRRDRMEAESAEQNHVDEETEI